MRVLVLLSLLATLSSAREWKRRFGKHDFPLHTRHGLASTNEFQFVEPENIVDARKALSLRGHGGGEYAIKSVSPTLINNNDVVTVTFATTAVPGAKDWIGAYSPASVDIKTTVPVKYGWCDDSPEYLTRGEGFLTFNLTNLRADVAFYYFVNSTAYPVLVAQSEERVRFKNVNEPLRARVVATGDPDTLKVLWSSASSQRPLLQWGAVSGEYTHSVPAETSHIARDDVCGAPASTTGWFDLGLIHTAPLSGLSAFRASDKIFYRFGDAETSDFSAEHVFVVPPVAGEQPPHRGTTVVLYDDLGRGSEDMTFTWYEYGRPALYTVQAVAQEILDGKVDAVYHGGDISYATGFLAVWDFFMNMLSPVASRVLYLSTVGNHESDWWNSASSFNNSDSGGECGVLTTRLLPMPAPATTDAPWWSYDVGLIHFVGLSTEHDYTVGSAQYLWLERDLSSVDREKTPWVVFGGHRAMYLNSNYGGSVSSDLVVMDSMIDNLEALLFKYRVNIGFYGHNHVVQRHTAVLNKTVVQESRETVDRATGERVFVHDDPQATVHFVVGTGGAAFTINAVTPRPAWNEMFLYEWGYARVHAVNATYLDWQWVESVSGEVHDHVVITQSDPTKPWRR